MNKRRKALLLAIVCLFAVLILLLASRGKEPQYNGRSLPQWVAIYESHLDEDEPTKEKQAAEAAVRRIGTNAIPCLLERIAYDPPRWQQKLDQFITQLPLVGESLSYHLFPYAEEDPFSTAQSAFAILGADACQAIPELTNLAEGNASPNVCGAATLALSSLGPNAVPPLLTLLASTNTTVRIRSANSLGFMGYLGTNAAAAVPALLNCLDAPQARLVQESARSLGRLRIEPAVVVPRLTNLLQHHDILVRIAAAESLSDFREQAVSAVPSLLELTGHSDITVRTTAIKALGQIGQSPQLAVPALTKCLGDRHYLVRENAAFALAKFGSRAAIAVPALSQALSDEEITVRSAATNALQNIVPAGSEP